PALFPYTTLFRSEEPEDDSDEWYEHELQDLKVMHHGVEVGVVTALRTNPAQDLLVFENAEGEEIFLPFVDEFVPEIDTEAGTLTITPPPGLLELNSEDSEQPEGESKSCAWTSSRFSPNP